MNEKLSKNWLVGSLARYGYEYTEEEWKEFYSKWLTEKKYTNEMIQNIFHEDNTVNAPKDFFISSKILQTIVRALEKYFKNIFTEDRFKKLILASILQYEKLHCCVLCSKGEKNIFNLIGEETPLEEKPFQLLVISLNGIARYSKDKFTPPLPCAI